MSVDHYVRLARTRERASSGFRPFVSVWVSTCRCGWTGMFDGVADTVNGCPLCDDTRLTWTVTTMPAGELPEYVEWFEARCEEIRALRGLDRWQL